jgi:hypothetical protein
MILAPFVVGFDNCGYWVLGCEIVGRGAAMKFYFRIVLPSPSDSVLDRVICVERDNKVDAEAYMSGRTDAVSWESVTPEQLPPDMVFRPATPLAHAVWESTTGFTPLGPRPTDPRDQTAKRNP